MTPEQKRRTRMTATIVGAIVLGMTGMAFAAVPIYEAFCRVTGYGGTTQTATAGASRVLDRTVEIRFDTNVAPGLPVEFSIPEAPQHLKLGETGLAFFRVRNVSDHPVTARANYNVTPFKAGQYFAKLECFCFQDRVLAPGETVELPVVYFVDPDLATDPDTEEVRTVTLSYTYFLSTDPAALEQSAVLAP